ncbi:Wall-associated kinase family protein [Rhynchospora pubera]|uniref:Wall-associated kinase family protein n=1 Tax=Rhynchospora pubera TaxID=906938 RepID=A0AAV8EWD0_9POAL|nr:Wall-associated kinase family protein [Rhynchospora pubera]
MDETKRNSLRHEVSTPYSLVALSHLLLLLLSPSKTKAAKSAKISLPGCPDSCGGVAIPYPFGIGLDCSMSEAFNVTCDATLNGKPTPYMTVRGLQILNISIPSGQARVNNLISYQCCNITTMKVEAFNKFVILEGTPYRFNHEKNKFVVIGCDIAATVFFWSGEDRVSEEAAGCISYCGRLEYLINGSCSGLGCCETSLPKGINGINVQFDESYNSWLYYFNHCGYAFLTEVDNEFEFDTRYITTDELTGKKRPVLLDWTVGNTTCDVARTNQSSFACKSKNSNCSSIAPGYLCNCIDGYEGNPYLEEGCQDIDECANQNSCSNRGNCHNTQGGYYCSCPFGWRHTRNNSRQCEFNVVPLAIGTCAAIVALSFLGISIYAILERRDLSKIKEKYFQQHGGWILLEKIKSNQEFGFTIFTKQQIEQATNNFDSANIIGHGGQGTIYKGTLRDHIAAIKKCNIVDENKKKEFGKEMLILSQINHKNIVRLLGCCLEVEVPMLVYEFIPNGTLFHRIHNKKQGSCISLATRLIIAQESAEALAYLHFSTSPPIFHGDVKSANILLDQNCTAKVSDFGASILAPTDEAQFVTFVQGTCGYLDPEYVQSHQLTDKSDVYSFGVVLLELLTRKPAIDFDAPEEERSLSSRFLCAMEVNKMHDLLDNEIKCEDDMEVIMKIAELAKECLNMKGEERPTMKEVAEELDRIRKLKRHPWGVEYNPEEIETLLDEGSHNIESEYSRYFNIDKEAEESIAVGR